MKNKFVIVTHAVLSESSDIAGPAHTIVSYLSKKNAEFLFIRHDLFKSGKTLVAYSKKDSTSEYEVRTKLNTWETFFRAVEGLRTIKIFLSTFKNTKPIYIGIDPLNSFWGVVLKKTNRIKKLITFTVDYSDKRYSNVLYNWLYHALDKFTISNSDYSWNVSKRIIQKRLIQGLSQDKLFVIPNSPPFEEIEPMIKKNSDPLRIITIATISKAVDFLIILQAIDELRIKYPRIRLTIIGAGPGRAELENKAKRMKLTRNVQFSGPKSHFEVFKILSTQGIGIALYTDEAPWIFYSDSMKARDYLALGLPVVISGDVGTAQEIKRNKAGILINRDKNELVNAIDRLISNQKLYIEFRENAINLARKNDVFKILDKIFYKSNLL